MSLVFFPLQGLMVSRYPGEDAVRGSHEVGNWNTPHPTSVLKLEGSFLPSPHPQVLSPVSRERIAHSYATSLIGDALPHGKSYLVIALEIFPLESFSVPTAIPQGPSFPLEKINWMATILENRKIFDESRTTDQ